MTHRQIRRLSIAPLAFFGLLALAGCVMTISSRPVVLPDGHLGYDVRCNGARNDIGDCMNEAARGAVLTSCRSLALPRLMHGGRTEPAGTLSAGSEKPAVTNFDDTRPPG